MRDPYHKVVVTIVILVIDLWLIYLAFTLTGDNAIIGDDSNKEVTLFFLLFSLLWIIAGLLFRINRFDPLNQIRNTSMNLVVTFLIHILMVHTVLITFDVFSVTQEFLLGVYSISGILIIGSRAILKVTLNYFEYASFDKRKIIIVGATASGRLMHQFFVTHRNAGYRFMGFFDDHNPKSRACRKMMVGKLHAIKEFCAREKVDEIYFALPPARKELLEDLSKFADDNFIYFRIVPDFGTFMRGKCDLSLMNSIPVLTATRDPLHIPTQAIFERVSFKGQRSWRHEKVQPSFEGKASTAD